MNWVERIFLSFLTLAVLSAPSASSWAQTPPAKPASPAENGKSNRLTLPEAVAQNLVELKLISSSPEDGLYKFLFYASEKATVGDVRLAIDPGTVIGSPSSPEALVIASLQKSKTELNPAIPLTNEILIRRRVPMTYTATAYRLHSRAASLVHGPMAVSHHRALEDLVRRKPLNKIDPQVQHAVWIVSEGIRKDQLRRLQGADKVSDESFALSTGWAEEAAGKSDLQKADFQENPTLQKMIDAYRDITTYQAAWKGGPIVPIAEIVHEIAYVEEGRKTLSRFEVPVATPGFSPVSPVILAINDGEKVFTATLYAGNQVKQKKTADRPENFTARQMINWTVGSPFWGPLLELELLASDDWNEEYRPKEARIEELAPLPDDPKNRPGLRITYPVADGDTRRQRNTVMTTTIWLDPESWLIDAMEEEFPRVEGTPPAANGRDAATFDALGKLGKKSFRVLSREVNRKLPAETFDAAKQEQVSFDRIASLRRDSSSIEASPKPPPTPSKTKKKK